MDNKNTNEEIDLMQIFGMIKNAFRKFLKGVVSILSFYQKKAMLFLILLILGAVAGYFLDQFLNKKDRFQQQVIVEAKYNSVEYMYDFVESLEDNLKDISFVKKLSLETSLIDNVKRISLEPVIQSTDVLGKLGDKDAFIESYGEKQLKEKKYRNFYKQHKLTLYFKNNTPENAKITTAILEYLKSNEYYKGIVDLEIKQTKISLEQHLKSLKFINEYLTNLTKNPGQDENALVFASESETPTIASLLKQKDTLLKAISREEERLALDREVLSVVDYGDIISTRKKLFNRTLFLLPLILIGLVSIFYLLKYTSRSVNEFINEEA